MTDNTPAGKRPERRPGPGRPGARKPGAGKPGPRKPGMRREDSAESGAKPRREGAPRTSRPHSGRPNGERSGGFRHDGPRRPRSGESSRDDSPRHDDPPVDADVTPKELDRAAFRELTALTKENAEWVAGHLVMASRVIDEDPERAHRHALAAARRAGRIAVVRESLGITAYVLGDYALALRELRTYRRLSGRSDQIPLMMDCERGLGRPARALELAGEVDRASLSPSVQVELAIARSGARLDLGQTDLALRELEIPYLTANKAYSFSPALFDSYAVVLAELGRAEEAAAWGRRADEAAEALAAHTDGEDETVVVVEMSEEA